VLDDALSHVLGSRALITSFRHSDGEELAHSFGTSFEKQCRFVQRRRLGRVANHLAYINPRVAENASGGFGWLNHRQPRYDSSRPPQCSQPARDITSGLLRGQFGDLKRRGALMHDYHLGEVQL
jgi:hypothetical protein